MTATLIMNTLNMKIYKAQQTRLNTLRLLFKLVVMSLISATAVGQQKPQRVLVIGLDGFSAEAFEKIEHPNLDRMIADGVLSLTTRPVMPSITLPNWTSHMTGSGPEEHGITSNEWTKERHTLNPLATDRDGYYPSIFGVLKEQQPEIKTAYYYNWKPLIYPINQAYLNQVSFEENNQYKQNYAKAFDFFLTNRDKPAPGVFI